MTTGTGRATDSGRRDVDAAWSSYMPAPETGLKIFAAGLLALVVSIGGLAALAIRRRG